MTQAADAQFTQVAAPQQQVVQVADAATSVAGGSGIVNGGASPQLQYLITETGDIIMKTIDAPQVSAATTAPAATPASTGILPSTKGSQQPQLVVTQTGLRRLDDPVLKPPQETVTVTPKVSAPAKPSAPVPRMTVMADPLADDDLVVAESATKKPTAAGDAKPPVPEKPLKDPKIDTALSTLREIIHQAVDKQVVKSGQNEGQKVAVEEPKALDTMAADSTQQEEVITEQVPATESGTLESTVPEPMEVEAAVSETVQEGALVAEAEPVQEVAVDSSESNTLAADLYTEKRETAVKVSHVQPVSEMMPAEIMEGEDDISTTTTFLETSEATAVVSATSSAPTVAKPTEPTAETGVTSQVQTASGTQVITMDRPSTATSQAGSTVITVKVMDSPGKPKKVGEDVSMKIDLTGSTQVGKSPGASFAMSAGRKPALGKTSGMPQIITVNKAPVSAPPVTSPVTSPIILTAAQVGSSPKFTVKPAPVEKSYGNVKVSLVTSPSKSTTVITPKVPGFHAVPTRRGRPPKVKPTSPIVSVVPTAPIVSVVPTSPPPIVTSTSTEVPVQTSPNIIVMSPQSAATSIAARREKRQSRSVKYYGLTDYEVYSPGATKPGRQESESGGEDTAVQTTPVVEKKKRGRPKKTSLPDSDGVSADEGPSVVKKPKESMRAVKPVSVTTQEEVVDDDDDNEPALWPEPIRDYDVEQQSSKRVPTRHPKKHFMRRAYDTSLDVSTEESDMGDTSPKRGRGRRSRDVSEPKVAEQPEKVDKQEQETEEEKEEQAPMEKKGKGSPRKTENVKEVLAEIQEAWDEKGQEAKAKEAVQEVKSTPQQAVSPRRSGRARKPKTYLGEDNTYPESSQESESDAEKGKAVTGRESPKKGSRGRRRTTSEVQSKPQLAIKSDSEEPKLKADASEVLQKEPPTTENVTVAPATETVKVAPASEMVKAAPAVQLKPAEPETEPMEVEIGQQSEEKAPEEKAEKEKDSGEAAEEKESNADEEEKVPAMVETETLKEERRKWKEIITDLPEFQKETADLPKEEGEGKEGAPTADSSAQVPQGEQIEKDASSKQGPKLATLRKELEELRTRNQKLENQANNQDGMNGEEVQQLQAKISKLETLNIELKTKVKDLEKMAPVSATPERKIGFSQGISQFGKMKFSFKKASATASPAPQVNTADQNYVKQKELDLAGQGMKARESQIEKRELKVKALDKELDERTAKLTVRESKLDRWERKLKSQEKELEYREKQIKRQENEIGNTEDTSEKKKSGKSEAEEPALKEMKKRLESKEKELKEREKRVKQRENDISERARLAAESEEQLAKLQEELSAKFHYLQRKESTQSTDDEGSTSQSDKDRRKKSTPVPEVKSKKAATAKPTPKSRKDTPNKKTETTSASEKEAEPVTETPRRKSTGNTGKTSKVKTPKAETTKATPTVKTPKSRKKSDSSEAVSQEAVAKQTPKSSRKSTTSLRKSTPKGTPRATLKSKEKDTTKQGKQKTPKVTENSSQDAKVTTLKQSTKEATPGKGVLKKTPKQAAKESTPGKGVRKQTPKQTTKGSAKKPTPGKGVQKQTPKSAKSKKTPVVAASGKAASAKTESKPEKENKKKPAKKNFSKVRVCQRSFFFRLQTVK